MKFDLVDVSNITKPKRKVFKVFIHCSASDNKDHDFAKVIENWHRDRGFSEIGYHYFIRKNGNVIEGRSLEKIPAAQEGHNTGSIAICVSGLAKEEFTKEQRASLKALCWTLNKLYKGGITFHGHCEVNSGKSCPVFSYKDWLGLDEYGRMH